MNRVNELIIAGASITNSPWFTWANHAEKYLNPKTTVNLSVKGCGNKFIALSVVNHLMNNPIQPDTLIMPMFTCVDKLDLYVDSMQVQVLKNQKHPPINLEAQYCKSYQNGFWSTGSHFPEIKSYYKEHYFNLDWMVIDTIWTLFALERFCQSKQAKLICLFDGDLWNYTEEDYNQIAMGGVSSPRDLLNGPLAKNFKNMLSDELLATNSLLEYAIRKNLDIYNPICKLHPPSDVHLKWFEELILPQIDFHINRLDPSYLIKVDQLTKEWHAQNY
jgi:hypothetical protein